MEEVIQTIIIQAPIKQCYDYSVDMTNLQSWGNGIIESRLASNLTNKEREYRVKIGLSFLNIEGIYTTYNREPEQFSFKAKTGTSLVKMDDHYKFERKSEESTILTLKHEAELASPWDKTGLIYQLVASSQIYLDLRNLKSRIEN
jgi:hypothetical protein